MPKEQHINTFNKGMTSDMNVIYQPDGTYRYAKNCQLISQDGNNYVIKDCLGNTLIFEINIPYTGYSGVGPTVTFGLPPMPIGFISFPNRLIVLSTNDETTNGGYGEIGEILYDTYGEGIQPRASSPTNTYSGYRPLYHHISLNFTKLHKIEGFAFNENEIHQRIYWTDNFNEPRVFDVANPIFTTYIASGSLVVGNQYMVLEGVINHNGGIHSPDAGGNVFTASITTYIDQFGGNIPTTAKVIAYYPYQLLNFTPSRSLGNIKFKEYGTGSLNCGSKIYFYRLADPSNGLYTSWSYGSSPVHVGTTNSVAAVPTNNFFDNVGGGSTNTLLNSGKSVRLDINGIDTNFPSIQLACAEYDQLVETPRQITIVDDVLITGSFMVLEHTGGTNLGALTLADITLFPASILTCKTITTDKNYILIGNIKERAEFTFDTSKITSAEISSRFAVHEYDTASCPNVLSYTDLSIYTNPTFIIQNQQYVVRSAGGGPIVYNGNNYFGNDVFEGVAGVTAVVIPAGSTLGPAVYRNKYDTFAGAVKRPEVIDNQSGFLTYKDPARDFLKKGYWANEKYRFGILFYDLKGNPMYVRWITDFTFSDYATNPICQRITTGAYDYWFLNQRAVKFSKIEIPPSIIDQISGFSIVRADRDKRIISEGMLMQTGASTVNLKPIAGPNPQTDTDWFSNATTYFSYICPDNQVAFPMTNYAVGSNLEGGFFLDATAYAANTWMKAVDVDYQVETRYMLPSTDGRTRKQKITSLATIDENVTGLNFGTGNYTFSNTTKFQAAVGAAVDNSCPSGFPSTTNIRNTKGIGGRRSIVELTATLDDFSTANSYGDLTTAGTKKLVIDTTVDKPNQYGGSSDTAIANTLYISTGHFQPINTTVKAEVFDGANYTFNNVEIWGGDCYTALADYGHSLYDITSVGNAHSWGIKFPCQCNTNYDLRRGRTIANNKMYAPAVPNGVCWNPLRLEGYSYNQGYSTNGIEFAYPGLPIDFSFATLFRYRIRFAGTKFPNEIINSFRNFFINDYKDIDGQGGKINNVICMNARVIILQDLISTVVPVLERQILSGLSGAPTTLGTGGVVDRYDPITSYFGNQHQHGLTKTEFGLIWFDMNRKAIVRMDLGTGTTEISKIDGLKGFFDEVFVDNIGNTLNPQPINSPDFSETADRPLMGVGIVGVYDPKFKMTYLTFKFKNYPSADQPLARDFTIGYYHPDNIFVSFFDVTPAIWHNHNQVVISANNPKNIPRFYGAGMPQTLFLVGDVISDLNIEYVCTTLAAVLVYATPPDPTKFTAINKTNGLWVNNQPLALAQSVAPGYLYNKIYGRVIDNELQFVINPKTANPFSVLNIEQRGNLVNVTDIYTSADNQSAADNNITGTNRWYRNIYDKICSNLPLSSTGRITNSYLLVRMVKKNWTTNPTVLTSDVRLLNYVSSFFEQKR